MENQNCLDELETVYVDFLYNEAATLWLQTLGLPDKEFEKESANSVRVDLFNEREARRKRY